MRFDIVTIFPALFDGVFTNGVVQRAQTKGLIEVNLHDLRAFTHARHRTVDDRPFGGGEGMVLKPEPLAEALASLVIPPKAERVTTSESPAAPENSPTRTRVILLSAQGRTFTQTIARELSQLDRVVLICGRYEGVDERITQLYCDMELSIGDYVLSGGELAAAVVVDAAMRLIPGVLGNEASSEFESFGLADADIDTSDDIVPRSQYGAGGLLDYPHYTRPAEFGGVSTPEVLLNGDHHQIRLWRHEQQLRKTLANRPDLLEHAILSQEDRALLKAIRDEGPTVD